MSSRKARLRWSCWSFISSFPRTYFQCRRAVWFTFVLLFLDQIVFETQVWFETKSSNDCPDPQESEIPDRRTSERQLHVSGLKPVQFGNCHTVAAVLLSSSCVPRLPHHTWQLVGGACDAWPLDKPIKSYPIKCCQLEHGTRGPGRSTSVASKSSWICRCLNIVQSLPSVCCLYTNWNLQI